MVTWTMGMDATNFVKFNFVPIKERILERNVMMET